MTSLNIRPYTVLDLSRIRAFPSWFCWPEALAMVQGLPERNAFAITHEGEIVCLCGIFTPEASDPGLGYAWLIPTSLAEDHKVTFLKCVRQCLDQLMDKMNLRRVHSFNRCEPQYDRLMQFLGFENEAILKQLAPDGDRKLWAIIRS